MQIRPVERPEQASFFASFEYAREMAARYVKGWPGWRVTAMPKGWWAVELDPARHVWMALEG